MTEPNILCVALPVKSNRINAYNVQILHELEMQRLQGTEVLSAPSVHNGCDPQTHPSASRSSELVVEGLRPSDQRGSLIPLPNSLTLEATSNGRPMSSFSENMLNISYVCAILCKLLMIGSIVMIIVIIILSAKNRD
jgi:hypothetical protein